MPTCWIAPQSFTKDYLRAVVDKIGVIGKTATISASYPRLLSAVGEKRYQSSALLFCA